MAAIELVCRRKLEKCLVDCCTPVLEVASRRQLHSASRHHLTVSRYRLNTFGRLRAFSVAGPTSWNTLPNRLLDPTLSSDSFRGNYLERGTICELLNTLSAVETLRDSALCMNSQLTLTLTLVGKCFIRRSTLACFLVSREVGIRQILSDFLWISGWRSGGEEREMGMKRKVDGKGDSREEGRGRGRRRRRFRVDIEIRCEGAHPLL